MKYDIGFLGGGQLARMSIQAAQRMGLNCLSLDPETDTPASGVADAIIAPLNDIDALADLFRSCQYVTLENEFVPAAAVAQALKKSSREPECLTPTVECLGTIQDKLRQRLAYDANKVPSPKAVGVEGDLEHATETIGFPMVLKARFGGYDGKGTRYAKNETELKSVEHAVVKGGWLAEQFVDFAREVAVMVCRSKTQTACFPTMVTEQRDHVCDFVYPSNTDASKVAIAAVEAVDGVGLFGVEMFECQDGSFSINEIAPRPHNSGHYTLDWGGMSQFEAHVRLVLGLPLPELNGHPTCMANLLGIEHAGDLHVAARTVIEADPGVRLHWYGKAETRPGRKMGHLNVVGDNCVARARAAQNRFYESWRSP